MAPARRSASRASMPIGYGTDPGRGGASDDRDAGPGRRPRDARRSTGPTCRWRFGSTAPTTSSTRPLRSRWAASSAFPPTRPPTPSLRSRASVVASNTGGARAVRTSTTTTPTSRTELAVTLGVARARGPRRLVAVFQPHRYSRTQALWRELGASLVGADLIVVTDVYGANQTPIPGVTGALVVDGVRRGGPRAGSRLRPARRGCDLLPHRRGARG